MTPTPQAATGVTDLKTLFQSAEIDKVAIIDDAFDVPRKDNIGVGDIKDFLIAVEKSELAKSSWKSHDIYKFEDFDEINSDDINNDEIISKLWRISETNSCELSNAARGTIFLDSYQRRANLDPLIKFLRETGIEVAQFPSSTGADDLTGFKVIFIDYLLSLGAADADPVKTASNLANQIYTKDKHRLFLLISTTKVNHDQINEFIDAAELVGGVFYFVNKNIFNDSIKLHIKLSNVIKALPHSKVIQEFTESIESSLDKAKSEFLNAVKRLTLEDYAHLYTLSLKSDGHPLGDYMLWLFESYFGYLLFKHNETLRKAQMVLDTTDFQIDMIRQIMPSQSVSDFHSHAMFMAVEDIVEIPESCDKVPPDASLSLGDIFIKDNSVLMVINAQCDLADQRRQYIPDLRLLLICGRLIPLEAKVSTDNDTHITQIFLHNNNKYRIVWDIKDVCSCRHGDLFQKFKTERGYERKYRLNMPYSYQIQHEFASSISRVGIPVTPPVDSPVVAQIYYKNHSMKVVPLAATFNGVYIDQNKPNQKKLCFTEIFINELIDGISDIRKEILSAIESFSGAPAKKVTLEDYARKLDSLLTQGEFSKLLVPAVMQKNGSKLNGTTIKVYFNEEPTNNIETIGFKITNV